MKPTHLTKEENRIFDLLEAAAPHPVSRAILSAQPYPTSNKCDVHIKNLRPKLKDTGYSITAHRGSGYSMLKPLLAKPL